LCGRGASASSAASTCASDCCLPYHRAIVATAAGAGLRWGEAAGLRADALDVDGARFSVIRTVVEVGGHTTFKAYPKSRAGRRTIPLPGWLAPIIRAHLAEWPTDDSGPIFANEVGGPLRRTLFRTRIWRPSLVRAGMLGAVVQLGHREWNAQWTDTAGVKHSERLRSEAAAVNHVVRHQQRVMGHERSSTTLDLYTRRTDNSERILQALDELPPTSRKDDEKADQQ
jgi:integrase